MVVVVEAGTMIVVKDMMVAEEVDGMVVLVMITEEHPCPMTTSQSQVKVSINPHLSHKDLLVIIACS